EGNLMTDDADKAWAERWQSDGTTIYRLLPAGEPWEERDDEVHPVATFHEPNATEHCAKAMKAINSHDAFVAALTAFVIAYQLGVSPELDKAHHDAVTALSDMQNGTHYPPSL